MKVSKRIFATLLASVVFGGLAPGTTPHDSHTATLSLARSRPTARLVSSGSGTCYSYKSDDKAFASATNASRTSHGLGKLQLDPQLSKAARVHTEDMARNNRLYHTTSPDLRHRVTNWVTLGENVGEGGTVPSLQTAFMNSPEHRANILDTGYRYVGIGTVQKGSILWVTVIFESRRNPGTRLSMPSC